MARGHVLYIPNEGEQIGRYGLTQALTFALKNYEKKHQGACIPT